MLKLTKRFFTLEGPGGALSAPTSDLVLPKFAMLFEGECEGLGPTAAAAKFGFSRQRYFQLRDAFTLGGMLALLNQKRGPKTNYRRTDQVIQQVVRHRFLDPDASAEVIAQKLRQSGFAVSTRSVERIVAEFGLQKKTPLVSPRPVLPRGAGAAHSTARPRRARRR